MGGSFWKSLAYGEFWQYLKYGVFHCPSECTNAFLIARVPVFLQRGGIPFPVLFAAIRSPSEQSIALQWPTSFPVNFGLPRISSWHAWWCNSSRKNIEPEGKQDQLVTTLQN